MTRLFLVMPEISPFHLELFAPASDDYNNCKGFYSRAFHRKDSPHSCPGLLLSF
jgi:hypothetical protein